MVDYGCCGDLHGIWPEVDVVVVLTGFLNVVIQNFGKEAGLRACAQMRGMSKETWRRWRTVLEAGFVTGVLENFVIVDVVGNERCEQKAGKNEQEEPWRTVMWRSGLPLSSGSLAC